MRVTQGTFSFLPDLSDVQIRAQIEYCLRNGWAVSVEFTHDPHPRNTFWEMWSLPMFDLTDAAGVMSEVDACRKANPELYVKVNAFDSSHGWEALRMSFIVNRPKREPELELVRQEGAGRKIRYSARPHVTHAPEGRRS